MTAIVILPGLLNKHARVDVTVAGRVLNGDLVLNNE